MSVKSYVATLENSEMFISYMDFLMPEARGIVLNHGDVISGMIRICDTAVGSFIQMRHEGGRHILKYFTVWRRNTDPRFDGFQTFPGEFRRFFVRRSESWIWRIRVDLSYPFAFPASLRPAHIARI